MAESSKDVADLLSRIDDQALFNKAQRIAMFKECAVVIRRLSAASPANAEREALQECIDVLALVEHPRIVDPFYGEEVRCLGERIGYGALMSSASASWRNFLAANNYPLGGEFVAGPCHATVISTLKKARAALTSEAELPQ